MNRVTRRIRSPRAARGLTLLEVIIAIALIALLMGSMFTFYFQTVAIREQAMERADRTQIARQVLDKIAEEIRGCVGFDEVGFPVAQRLLGDRRSINFLTTALPGKHQYAFLAESDDVPPGQHDLVQVSYSLWVDDEELDEEGNPLVSGILRTAKKTLNQYIVDESDPLDLRIDLWSPELLLLEFRYFDGVEWTTVWDITEGNSLPQLIQVTVGFNALTMVEYEDRDLDEFPLSDYPLSDDVFRADRYSVIVRIPAADKFFASRIQRVGRTMTDQLGVGGGF